MRWPCGDIGSQLPLPDIFQKVRERVIDLLHKGIGVQLKLTRLLFQQHHRTTTIRRLNRQEKILSARLSHAGAGFQIARAQVRKKSDLEMVLRSAWCENSQRRLCG